MKNLFATQLLELLKILENRLKFYENTGINITSKMNQLEFLKDIEIANCQRCKLSKTRNSIVFGSGNPNAKVVFIGEAPGATEDCQGIPFVGRAGQLLTKMIEAMNMTRADVYLCNVIKCRPPDNRNPEKDELDACKGFLSNQLEIINPRIIITLGQYAAKCLFDNKLPIGVIRGKYLKYKGIFVVPTFHPAYLLRNPSKKKDAWEDLQRAMSLFKKLN